MSEDEFRTDLRWPTDPLGERRGRHLAPEDVDDEHLAPTAVDDEPLDVDLARVLSEMATLRQAVDGVSADLTALRAERGRLQEPRSFDAIAEELTGIREELVSLRRRITLRVGASTAPLVLTDGQLEHLAQAVANRLGAVGGRRRR